MGRMSVFFRLPTWSKILRNPENLEISWDESYHEVVEVTFLYYHPWYDFTFTTTTMV